jgi:sec-independent protein translocase protein TatC
MSKNAEKLTIWEHLEELRKRLIVACLGLGMGIVISLVLSDYMLALLAKPIGGFNELQSIEVTENVGVFMRVTLLGGFIIAFPFILVQILLFILPALEKKEKRWLFITVPFATLLFIGGAAFSYLVMLPSAIPLFTQFKGPEVLPSWKTYVDFVTNLIFWFGLSFETPLLMFVLAKVGVINAKQLANGWQIAVIVISVIAAAITPTVDPINMLLFMVPLFLLYLLSILLALMAHR